MGNIINFADKCMRCGNENMFKDYDYRTGEGAYSCNACGMVRSAFIKRDITGSTITTDVEYPIDGNLVMAVRAYHPYIWGKDNAQLYNNLPEEGTILWEKPITSEMNLDDINEFMSPKTEKIYQAKNDTIGTQFLVDSNSAYAEAYAFEHGIRNIFYKANGEYKQLWYIGNGLRIESDANGKPHFILEKSVWDVFSSGGYGYIYICAKSEKDSERKDIYCDCFEKIMSAEEALNIWNNCIPEYLDTSESYLTIWDEEINKLVCLKGKLPEENYCN